MDLLLITAFLILLGHCLVVSVIIFISLRKTRILTRRVDYLYFVLQLADLGPVGNRLLIFKVPETNYEKIELVKKFCEGFRANIIELSNKVDLSDKIKVDEVIEELDAIINLISTIDEKSSPAYMDQVLNELQICVNRITSIIKR